MEDNSKWNEREKRYVPVIVRFNEEGKLRPILIEFDESHKYPVDKVWMSAGLPARVWAAWETDIPASTREGVLLVV